MSLTTNKYDAKKEMFQKLVDIAENYLMDPQEDK